MPFLPDTPLTVFYACAMLVTIAVAAAADRRSWPICAVMAANWLGTRGVTAWELPAVEQAGVDLASAVVLVAARPFSNMAVLPVAALFCLMVTFGIANDLGFISREAMWAGADVAAYAQLVILAGASVSGGGIARLVVAFRLRRRGGDLVRAVARRVPPR